MRFSEKLRIGFSAKRELALRQVGEENRKQVENSGCWPIVKDTIVRGALPPDQYVQAFESRLAHLRGGTQTGEGRRLNLLETLKGFDLQGVFEVRYHSKSKKYCEEGINPTPMSNREAWQYVKDPLGQKVWAIVTHRVIETDEGPLDHVSCLINNPYAGRKSILVDTSKAHWVRSISNKDAVSFLRREQRDGLVIVQIGPRTEWIKKVLGKSS